MIRKLQQCQAICLLSLLVVVVSACSSSSSGGDGGDNGDSGSATGGDQDPSGSTTIVPLSSLGPLMDRLYPQGMNRQLLTGPIIGADLTPTSELLREIPFEVNTSIAELVVEKTYVMRQQDTQRFSGTVSVNTDFSASHFIVAILTNVSNRMICDFRIREVQFEATDGEIRTASPIDLFGYMARNPETNHFEQDCIPPGLSAFATGFFLAPEVFDNDFNAVDPGKFVIGEVVGPIRDAYEPFNGVVASSYVEDANEFHRHRYSVNIVNPSDQDFEQDIVGEGIVLVIDPTTGLPIYRFDFSRHDDRPASFDFFTPGAEGEFQFVGGSLFHEFSGSSNTIFVMIDHIEEGNF